MPKNRPASKLEVQEEGASISSPMGALAWSGAALDFHRVSSGGGQASVCERLGAAQILLKQEPDTPTGYMVLYREGTFEEVGLFTGEGALAQLSLGFAAPKKKGRKAEA